MGTSHWASRSREHASREAWLLSRREGLGATDVCAILKHEIESRGGRVYGSPLTVYASKLDEGPIEPEGFVEKFYWGNQMEPQIATRLEMAAPVSVSRTPLVCVFHKRHGEGSLRAFCSPDAVVRDGSVLGGGEFKLVDSSMAHEWRDGAPLSVRVQAQWQMACTGWPWVYVAALIGFNKFVYERVDRDERLIGALESRAADWWQRHIIDREIPDVSGATTEDAGAISSLWDGGEGDVELAGDFSALTRQFREASAEHKAAGQLMDGIRNRVRRELMKHGATYGRTAEGVWSWKKQRDGKRVLRLGRAT